MCACSWPRAYVSACERAPVFVSTRLWCANVIENPSLALPSMASPIGPRQPPLSNGRIIKDGGDNGGQGDWSLCGSIFLSKLPTELLQAFDSDKKKGHVSELYV